MFTGIIEQMGRIHSLTSEGTNQTFWIEAEMGNELKVDQSVAHNGVCLTVVAREEWSGGVRYAVTAIQETLQKTNLGQWKPGTLVNLERCMPAHGRFDGHIVQGHVDQTGTLIGLEDKAGSWLLTIQYDPARGNITVEKGSICLNGISLTVVDSQTDQFSVAIIPYTWEHTNLHTLSVGEVVNLEFDILGKYMQKIMGLSR